MNNEKPLIDDDFLLLKYPGKGGWTYTTFPGKLKSKKNPFGWGKVKGKVDDYEFSQYNLFPTADGNIFFPVKAEIRKKIKKEAGDVVHITLYHDDNPIEIPDELLLCLVDDPIAHQNFFAFKEGEQKAYIDWIYAAKREETKIDRMVKALNKIALGRRFYDRDE